MAKTKSKEVAASDVPSDMEETTGNVVESAPPTSVNTEEETTMVVDTAEEDAKEETKGNDKVESVGTDDPEGEKVDEGDKTEEVKATEEAKATEEVKGDEKGKTASKKKGKVLGKRKKKAVTSAAASSEKKKEAFASAAATSEKKEASASAAATSEKTKEASASADISDEKPKEKLKEKPNGTDQPKTQTVDKKKLKMADGMGLIFMCNAKTKKDCFHYKVLGLPASKKGMVEKVYKGMRLFLFDVDLKLMYGIYKAASPGGYNLEPKAFKSAFPSQVRFNVLDDCLPLPEEKFKAAIKENYYGRNKFNCQLSVEQVRNLCKLFKRAGKAPSSTSKKSREAIRAEPEPRSADRGRKRRSQAEAEPSYTVRDSKRRSRAEPEPSSADRDRRRRPQHERIREDRFPPRIRGRDLYSRREAYASSPPRPVAYGSPPRLVAMPPPARPPSYGYDRLLDDYYYRRDPLPSAELRDHRIMNVVDTRPREPIEHRDPYALYREPLPYREPAYAPASQPSTGYALPTITSLPSMSYAPPYPPY
ncbi:uncharacterized protein M6B38_300855 [Iris pallida]|uniref:DCD domain-containing protein n=1 Tax=Iris pallida TaxID=29817 RepID=A0AAX6H3I1_IRIPA|nr:uncharacterized protein M6B38_331430 [Iris pallida]KAJ6843266.1 uncharacterized protein M6B38_300855 [Iris pallida]